MSANEPKLLVCPDCGRSDELKSVERVLGHLGMTLAVVEGPDGKAEVATEYHDSTEMFWDTSETVGVHCRNCDYDDCNDEGDVPELVMVDGVERAVDPWLARLIAAQPELKED